ncbi:MAG: hypothetical protein Q7R96_01360 [Nanoarchaeota archaeon]|nr:hypothetical protein [Nanoarchaeota archaeon]
MVNPPYQGVVIHREVVPSVPVKVYVMNIRGRDSPANYEWRASALNPYDVLHGLELLLLQSDYIGIPHVAFVFPHVTNVYRFGDPRKDERETNVYAVGMIDSVKLLDPKERLFFPAAVGCVGELAVLGREVDFWSAAGSVDEYFVRAVDEHHEILVVDPNKLAKRLGL